MGADWPTVRLGDVSEIDTGGTPSRSRPEYWNGTIRWMSSGEVHQRRVRTTTETITDAGLANSNAKVFQPGTVMVALNGQGRTRGRAAILEVPASCNQSLAAVMARPEVIEHRYLFHVLDAAYEALRGLTGDGRSGLNLGLLRAYRFPLPRLPEQRAIATILDVIDDAIKRAEDVVAATKTLHQSLVNELLAHGVPGLHSNWKRVRGLGAVPDCWEIRALADCLSESPTNGLYKPHTMRGRGVPLIRVQDFESGRMTRLSGFERVCTTLDELQRYQVREGDILLNRVNSGDNVAKAVMFPGVGEPAVFESNMMRLRATDPSTARYLGLHLISTRARLHFRARAKKAVQQQSVNQEDVTSLPVALPPMDERVAIVHTVDAARRFEQRSADQLQVARKARSVLAQALLSGALRIRPADANFRAS